MTTMYNNLKRIQIGMLLDIIKFDTKIGEIDKQLATIILHQLQAGRVQEGNMNVPYRLSDEELKLLQDEWIEWGDDGDRYVAFFVNDVNNIRAKLNLPPQYNLF